jgi:hypothetical protein
MALLTAVLVAWSGPASAQAPALSDTLQPGSLLERLQREDRSFYSDEIVELDRALADSGLATLDSLGFEAFERETLKGARRSGLSFGFATELGLYNRVEGGIAGAGMRLRVPVVTGPELRLQGGYASGPRKFRHYESLRVPLSLRYRAPAVEAGYADRAVRYYADEGGEDLLTAFFGSDAEENYLHRRGGWLAFSWEGSPVGRWSLRAEAAKEDTVRRRTDYGLFGGKRDMSPNLPVDEGRDRAIEGAWALGSVLSGRQQIALRHRVAGGMLGGDFAYSRFAATVSARRFLPWNHEAILDLTHVRVGGRPPEQRLADLGGLGTVRGFLPRSRVGTESLRARLEVQVPYDVFKRARVPLLRKAGLQLVPWADAGRTWGEDPASGDGSGTWLTSAGLGVQKLLGPFGEASFLRLDVAVPMGPERPDDVRAYLYFARGLF